MSTANQTPDQPQAQLDQATQAIFDGVTVPAFFTKLASYGVVPENDRQAAAFLSIGRDLFEQEQAGQLQQADSTTSVLEKMAADLRGQAYQDESSVSLQQQILGDAELLKAAGLITAAIQ